MVAGVVTTRQAAQALGVSEASLKRWCDQGVVPAVRTPGGHRRLPLSGIVQFVRERGLEIAQPAVLGLPRLSSGKDGNGDSLLTAMQEALETADEESLRGLLFGRYLAGTSVADLLDELVVPAFREIGDKWSHGDLAIYEEHRAVELCTRLVHQLKMLLPVPGSDAPRAIGGTLTGDPYSLPTTMLETALTEAGWRAESYGCGLPAATLADALRRVHPRLLWLSVSVVASKEVFLSECEMLYAAAQEASVAVLLGGRSLTPEMRERLSYSAYGDNLRHAVAFVRALHPPNANDGGNGEVQR
jgi:excisionase family DNA binding protein